MDRKLTWVWKSQRPPGQHTEVSVVNEHSSWKQGLDARPLQWPESGHRASHYRGQQGSSSGRARLGSAQRRTRDSGKSTSLNVFLLMINIFYFKNENTKETVS